MRTRTPRRRSGRWCPRSMSGPASSFVRPDLSTNTSRANAEEQSNGAHSGAGADARQGEMEDRAVAVETKRRVRGEPASRGREWLPARVRAQPKASEEQSDATARAGRAGAARGRVREERGRNLPLLLACPLVLASSLMLAAILGFGSLPPVMPWAVARGEKKQKQHSTRIQYNTRIHQIERKRRNFNNSKKKKKREKNTWSSTKARHWRVQYNMVCISRIQSVKIKREKHVAQYKSAAAWLAYPHRLWCSIFFFFSTILWYCKHKPFWILASVHEGPR